MLHYFYYEDKTIFTLSGFNIHDSYGNRITNTTDFLQKR